MAIREHASICPLVQDDFIIENYSSNNLKFGVLSFFGVCIFRDSTQGVWRLSCAASPIWRKWTSRLWSGGLRVSCARGLCTSCIPRCGSSRSNGRGPGFGSHDCEVPKKKSIWKKQNNNLKLKYRQLHSVSPAVLIVDHPINLDAVTHVYRQHHGEKPSSEICSRRHSEWGTKERAVESSL